MTLTKRQQQILDFIRFRRETGGGSPSLREIAKHFRFRSVTAAADHISALVRKGLVKHQPGLARSLQVVTPFDALRSTIVDIPVYGAIPAGFAEEEKQEATGCISVDVESLGIRSTARTFALQVRGDSMIGKYIVSGDYVIFEHGLTPHTGDVVAALIDNESTLKTYLSERGRPYLKAENPKYPKLIPATELVIQGVMVALIRKRR
jgi:repressor LexA